MAKHLVLIANNIISHLSPYTFEIRNYYSNFGDVEKQVMAIIWITLR